MAFETIGEIRGHAVKWNRVTGEIHVRTFGLISSSWARLRVRAFTTRAVFDLAEEFLRRQ